MTTREFTHEQMEELFDEAKEVDSRPWRHGRKVNLVFAYDDAYWSAWFDMHHDEGDQSCYPITAIKVHQVERTVKVWEPVP